MSNSAFQNMTKSIQRIVDRYGEEGVYTLNKTSKTATFIDEDAPSKGKTYTTTSYEITTIDSSIIERAFSGELIKFGDRKIYVYSTDVYPSESDKIKEVETDFVWEILDVKKYKTVGDFYFCKLYIRKGG